MSPEYLVWFSNETFNLPINVWSKCAHSHLYELQPYSSLTNPTSYPIFLFRLKNLGFTAKVLYHMMILHMSHIIWSYDMCYNKNFKCSWYNQHVGISAPVCIVSVDFVQRTNWFRGVKGRNLVSLFQLVFPVYTLIPWQDLNEAYNWNEYQMCIQHIWPVTHIDTFIKF